MFWYRPDGANLNYVPEGLNNFPEYTQVFFYVTEDESRNVDWSAHHFMKYLLPVYSNTDITSIELLKPEQVDKSTSHCRHELVLGAIRRISY